jgi:hypothetical protein
VVTAVTHVEVTPAIAAHADRPAMLADEFYLSGPPSTTDAIIKASTVTPKSNHPSPSVEVGLAILACADRHITCISGPPTTNAIMKASSVTPKSTHPSPSVEVGLAPISTFHSDINLLATEKLMIQEFNPVIVGPLGMAGGPPGSSSCPLPSIDLNLTSLQDAPPPKLIPTASLEPPNGGVVIAPMPLHQENWFLLFLDLNGSKCIYSTIDATIASISLIATIDN